MAHQLKSRGGAVIERQDSAKKKKNFINNEEFYAELLEYYQACDAAEAAGKEIPIIPNSIGQKLFMIADALGKKYYFIGYSYRDDMVMDGVETCIKYIRKFDPNKTKNPFSYFTQVCFYSFIQRIKTEKKQSYVKASIIKNIGVMFEDLEVQDTDMDEGYHTTMGEMLALQQDEALERLFNKPKEKKEKKQPEFDILDVESSQITEQDLLVSVEARIHYKDADEDTTTER